MTSPQTLLTMSGASPQPAPLSQSVLVVIDAQREYVDGALPLDRVQPALEEIARLLARSRTHGVPIIHVVHQGRAGGLFDPGAARGQVADPASPQPGEAVVRKTLPNAFAATDLDERLKALGRKNLIVTGFMTHMCVEATARAALDHGFSTTVVAAATATRDLPDPTTGARIAAAEVQRNALAALSDRFAMIVPSSAAVPD